MTTFVRVKHKETKHEFDVPENSTLIKSGAVELVKEDRYPASPVQRPAKYYVKPGQSAATKKEA